MMNGLVPLLRGLRRAPLPPPRIGSGAVFVPRRPMSGFFQRIKDSIENDPEVQAHRAQWKKHLEENPDVQKRVDLAQKLAVKTGEAASKAKDSAVTGVKLGVNVGWGTLDAIESLADRMKKSAVGNVARDVAQAIGETRVASAVSNTFAELTKPGSVFPQLPLMPRVAPPSQATTPAEGDTATTAAAEGAEGAEGEAKPEGEGAPAFLSALTVKQQTVWERAREKLKNMSESDNKFVATGMKLTTRVVDVADKIFNQSEMGVLIREAKRIDPNFNVEVFVRYARDMIPELLGAFADGDAQKVKQYAAGPALNLFVTSILERNALGYKMESRLLDLDNVDLISGKSVDDRVQLMVSYQSQQTHCLYDPTGKIVDGNPDDIRMVHTIWVFSNTPDGKWKVTEHANVSDNASF